MKKKSLFSILFFFYFLFLARGGWLPTPTRLDTGDPAGVNHSYSPQISCSGSNIYVVWHDYRNGNPDIYFNYSTDQGATWQATDTRLDMGDAPGASTSWFPKISSNGSNVYVVWQDDRNGEDDIYFNYSTDGGATWQATDIRLDTGDPPGESHSSPASISSDGNNIYVVWSDDRNAEFTPDIYFNYSTDGGATWQATDIRLDTGDAPGQNYSTWPRISSSDGNVYVAWNDDRSTLFDIYFNYSTDGGATWQATDIQLDTGDSAGLGDSWCPEISSSGSNVYVVWLDYRNGNPDIYFNYSTDGGANWQATDIRLDTGDTTGANASEYPKISSNGSNIYVVWYDERNGAWDIYFNYSTDGGATWQAADTRLDTGDALGANDSKFSQISSEGSNVFVVWADSRNGRSDIYFNCSTEGGRTWMTADTRLDTGDMPGASHSLGPQIACLENDVYVVWNDRRNGNYDIYFNTASSPIPDIKANGSDGPITITQSDPLIVTIDFDAGIQTGEEADWWVLMKTSDPKPNNWYYFDMPTRSWMLGRSPTRQGSLFDVSSKKVPKTSGLAPGTYTFYFAVDMVMNGSIDVGQAYYDKVKVTINP
jgi:hypothetical protein